MVANKPGWFLMYLIYKFPWERVWLRSHTPDHPPEDGALWANNEADVVPESTPVSYNGATLWGVACF